MTILQPIDTASFQRSGFLAPVRLLAPEQAHFLARHLRAISGKPLVWPKGLAVADPLVHELASSPALVRRLRALIGDEIVLWGAQAIFREPGRIHPWHCDMESCAPEGGFVSVWIGLRNTSRESALRFIPGSHLYGPSIQERAAGACVPRDGRTDEAALALAAAFDPAAAIAQPDVADGEALIFDGRIWHGSENGLTGRPRAALLLQYARSDISVQAPDFSNTEWPFRFRGDLRPPAIVVSGRGDKTRNELVAPPMPRDARVIPPSVHRIDTSLRCAEGVRFTPKPCFEGNTPNLDYLECHYSVLMPGHSPHLPHAHVQEEILVVMHGAGDLIVPVTGREGNPTILPAPAGTAGYYPAYQRHTIRNASKAPVLYAMMKWTNPCINGGPHLGARLVPSVWRGNEDMPAPKVHKRLLEGPTAYQAKLHAHATRVRKGGGYAAHRDEHDVAIFLIEGEITVMGERIAAPAVAFYPGGTLHDMTGSSEGLAKYLVFEFHRSARPDAHAVAPRPEAAGRN